MRSGRVLLALLIAGGVAVAAVSVPRAIRTLHPFAFQPLTVHSHRTRQPVRRAPYVITAAHLPLTALPACANSDATRPQATDRSPCSSASGF
jgi:hypothetical protein